MSEKPIFVDSTLKVVASEEIDIVKELAMENTANITIEQLLSDQPQDEAKED